MVLELFVWSGRVNAIFSFLMVALVLFSRPLTKVKIYWVLMCLSVGMWSVGLSWLGSSPDYSNALLGNMIITGSAIFIPVFFFHTVQSLIEEKPNFKLIAFYVSAAILTYLNIKGLLTTVRPALQFPYYTSAKPAYALFVCHLYIGFIFTCWVIWRATLETSSLRRKQLRLLFWGTALGFAGGQMTVPLVYGVEIFPWGVVFTSLYVLLVGYAMLRYQFLDFKMALRKLGLAAAIYACLLIITLPVTAPLLHAVANYPRLILLQGITAIVVMAVILAAGPLIYSFILNRSFWLKSNFTVGLTHELKSPLATIQSAVKILLDLQNQKNPEKDKTFEYLHMVERNTERLELFVQDLLAVAKIQSDDVNMNKSLIDLGKTIREVADTYSHLAEKKKVTFKFDLEEVMIEADPSKIQQVISNIISNSLKFSEAGEIKIRSHKKGKWAHCSVTDQGKGIPPKELDRVFERFFHGKHASKGAGLGLTIAKAWVIGHGGKIWAESEGEGKGTMVTFTLPTA